MLSVTTVKRITHTQTSLLLQLRGDIPDSRFIPSFSDLAWSLRVNVLRGRVRTNDQELAGMSADNRILASTFRNFPQRQLHRADSQTVTNFPQVAGDSSPQYDMLTSGLRPTRASVHPSTFSFRQSTKLLSDEPFIIRRRIWLTQYSQCEPRDTAPPTSQWECFH